MLMNRMIGCLVWILVLLSPAMAGDPIVGTWRLQSFVREVTTDPEDAAITTSIILMGKSLKLKIVAEGVETESQLQFLRVLECDEAQGFLFGRPMPAADARALLARPAVLRR